MKPEIRKSLLAKMLSELLDTRVMVKSSMKAVQQDRVRRFFVSPRAYAILNESLRPQALTKLLNARQLALKFLANVGVFRALSPICRAETLLPHRSLTATPLRLFLVGCRRSRLPTRSCRQGVRPWNGSVPPFFSSAGT